MKWNYKDFEITVNEYGVFEGRKDDLMIREDTLHAVREKIDRMVTKHAVAKRAIALPVVGLLRKNGRVVGGTVHRAKMVGFNRATGQEMYEIIPDGFGYHHAMVDTQNNAALLNDFALADERRSQLNSEVQKQVVASGSHRGRIDPERYEDVLRALEQTYAKKKAEALEREQLESQAKNFTGPARVEA